MMHTVHQHGFALRARVIDAEARGGLLEALGPVSGAGRRGLLGLAAVRQLAGSRAILELIEPHLAMAPVAVRAIYFDKTAATNWLVPWHQDLSVALRERIETPGFGPWSVKEGVVHVQPPVECLQQMLTIRLHLDAADEANGALRVLPGSHCLGRLSAPRIQELRVQQSEHLCAAAAGDALLMRPLLLHASSRSSSALQRRILHIEYAGFELPAGLRWREG